MATTRQIKLAATQRKTDALELAQLLYDIYKEQKRNGKIVSGQTDAQSKKT